MDAVRWVVIDRPALSIATAERRLYWRDAQPKSYAYAGSKFRWIKLSDVKEQAPECIVAEWGPW